MHKSFKTLALAGAAMTAALTPAMTLAQDAPDQTMPDTSVETATTPPTAPATTAPETTAPDTTTTDTGTPPLDSDTVESTTTEPAPAPGAAPIDQQAAMDAWPADTKDYYQSLTPERQKMFWALSDTDKVRLSGLSDEQKEMAWTQIESQIKPPRG